MMRSMTAFARAEVSSDLGSIIWEIRSVNHRYLETSMRLPENLRYLEPVSRDLISKRLGRGKIECNLKFQAADSIAAEIHLNLLLVERLIAAGDEVKQLLGSQDQLRAIDVLTWPGVVHEPQPDMEPLKDDMLRCLDRALNDLIATREREGERIETMLRSRCSVISEQVAVVRKRRPQLMQRLREKLLNRIEDLPAEADPGRLEQELAIIAQRLDVDEELDRLDAHMSEIAQVLQRNDPVGRRLDFLMQELNREANTLASKSSDAQTTRASTEIKVLIEQMREQVQNLE